MFGRAVSLDNEYFNVIILAGGNGTRMGEQSDYIPKALSQLGSKRAIDLIIDRYSAISHKFIIGTGRHADLLENYVLGNFPELPIEFSREDYLVNNAVSAMYCLDHADSRHPTLVLFCDLLVVSNPVINTDTILVAGDNTRGNIGTFRHLDRFGRGILGHFSFSDTYLLKYKTYESYFKGRLGDFTENVVAEYAKINPLKTEECEVVYEFGTEDDLQRVRKLWEEA